MALRELQIALNRSDKAPPAGKGWVNWQHDWVTWYNAMNTGTAAAKRQLIPESEFTTP